MNFKLLTAAIKKLKSSYKKAVIFCFAFNALVLLTLIFITPIWEGSVLIRVGQLNGELIDNPLNIVAMINSESFAAGLNESKNYDLRARQISERGLIEVRVHSNDSRRKCLVIMENIIESIKLMQSIPFDNFITLINSQIDEVNLNIKYLERGIDGEHSKIKPELNNLMKQKFLLEAQLIAPKTFSTYTYTNVYVPNKPAFPNKSMLMVMSFFVSIILVFSFIIKNASRKK